MGNAKMTPPPWVWIKRGNYHELIGGNGVVVISDGSASGEYKPDIDVKGPDGRLIAEAPIMLAALEAHQVFRDHQRNCTACVQAESGSCAEGERMFAEASNLDDVAIARAKGETQ